MAIRLSGNAQLNINGGCPFTAASGSAGSATVAMRVRFAAIPAMDAQGQSPSFLYGYGFYGLSPSGPTVGTSRPFSASFNLSDGSHDQTQTFAQGTVYDLARVFDQAAGTYTYYVNGSVVAAVTLAAGTALAPPTSGFNFVVLQLGAVDLFTWDVEHYAAIQGYAATPANVASWFNRTATPDQWSPSHLLQYASFDGPYTPNVTPVVAANGDAALGPFTVTAGSPTYVGPLVYVPPVVASRIVVGGSGRTVQAFFQNTSDGSPAIVSAHSGAAPTITYTPPGGGSPVTLATSDPAFELANLSAPSGAGMLSFRLPSAVPAGATAATFSAPSGWATAGGYVLTAASAIALDLSVVGGNLTPSRLTTAPTMLLGTNVGNSIYYDPIRPLTNLAREANPPSGFAAQDSILNIAAHTTISVATISGTQRFARLPGPGTYTLSYDGVAGNTPNLAIRISSDPTNASNTVPLASGSYVNGPGNLLTFTYPAGDATSQDLILYADTGGAILPQSLKITGPNIPAGYTSQFTPGWLAKVAGQKILRTMVSQQVSNSNFTAVSQLPPAGWNSYGLTYAPRRLAISSVTSFDPTTGPAPYWWMPTGGSFLEFATTAPHKFASGQTVEILTAAGTTATVAMSSGSPITFNQYGTKYQNILVIDSTHFAVFNDDNITRTVSGTQSIAGIADGSPANVMAVADTIDGVNQVGADIWACVPYLLPPTEMRNLANIYAAGLAPGRSIYVEWSNENWNSIFAENAYCQSMWRSSYYAANHTAPPTDATSVNNGAAVFAATQAKGAFDAFDAAWAAAGRPLTQVKHVFAGQFGVDSVLLDPGLAQLAALGARVDVISGAPYLDGSVPYSDGSYQAGITAAYDDDQAHDYIQARFTSEVGGLAAGVASALATARSRGFGSAQWVAYEGSIQTVINLPGRMNPALNSVAHYFFRNPRVYATYLAFLRVMQSAGAAGYVDFYFGSAYGSGDGNATEVDQMWGKYNGDPIVRGYGDGSDGLYDNRTANTYSGGVAAEDVTKCAHVVSVVGQLFHDWNTYGSSAGPAPVKGFGLVAPWPNLFISPVFGAR